MQRLVGLSVSRLAVCGVVVWWALLSAAMGQEASEEAKEPAQHPPAKAFQIAEAAPAGEILRKAGELSVQASEKGYLDIDEERGLIYARSGARIRYREYALEADRLILDVRLKEVQASGNVVLRSPGEEITADSMWYNFERNEGAAFNAGGHQADLYFKAAEEKKGVPSFQRLSKEEALFRDASFTTCEFSVPHYRIRAREVILYLNDRIFARGAILYIWEIPVFYFPAYSHSLYEHTPWSFTVGHSRRLGGFVRIGYDYRHSLYEPGFGEEEKMRRRSAGQMALKLDYFERRGVGYGAVYKYEFGYGKHGGLLDLYGIKDRGRELAEEEEPFRWLARLQHRSVLSKYLTLVLNIDEVHDADLYWEMLDRFRDQERGRVAERQARGALTMANEALLARLLFELKDRVSRNRLSNFAEPGDDDLDFDEDPYSQNNEDDEGLPRKRFGRVGERAPQLTVTTKHLKLWGLPLYYCLDMNAINNLDPGFNLIDRGDDAYVQGVDLYQSLMYRLRLGKRYTLLSKLGGGVAYLKREDEEYHYDFPAGATFPYTIDGLTFAAPDVIYTGSEQRALSDVDPMYVYGDAEVRLNARFSEVLTAYILYKIREGSKDSLGEYYESLGNKHFLSDIYAFRLREHWIKGNVTYYLKFPNLYLTAEGGSNLQSNDEIYANETRNFASVGTGYENDTKTFNLLTSVNYQSRQIRDPSDVNEFHQNSVSLSCVGSYVPKRKQWWARLGAFGYKALDEDPLGRTRGLSVADPEYARRMSERSYYEDETEVSLEATLGGKIGPKYEAEIGARYNTRIRDLSAAHVIVRRDLHDFIAQVLVGFRNDPFEPIDSGDQGRRGKRDWEVRFSLKLKSPYEKARLTGTDIKTMVDKQELPVSEYF
jgi:hypothetical protein